MRHRPDSASGIRGSGMGTGCKAAVRNSSAYDDGEDGSLVEAGARELS